jgi:hypothetical protein
MENNFRTTLLISAKELKNNGTILSGNIDDNYLSSTIVTCQEVYLEQITGTALYHKLQMLVYNQITGQPDGIYAEGNEDYRELLEEMVKPYLKARATVDILYPISYKVRNMGVMKNSDTNLQPADMSDIKYLEKQYLTYVAEYEQRLSKYLCANREKFEELDADVPSYFDQPSLGKEYANDGGLWLGSKKKKSCGC